MGDELDPKLHGDTDTFEDPLAELARIVAGEPEPDPEPEPVALQSDETQAAVEETPVAPVVEETPVAPVETPVVAEEEFPAQAEPHTETAAEHADDEPFSEAETAEAPIQQVESALEAVERELNAVADAEDVAGPDSPSPGDEPAVSEEAAVVAEPLQDAAVEQVALENTANAEISFQDDLISAIRDEIEQPLPSESEPAVHAAVTPATEAAGQEEAAPETGDGAVSQPFEEAMMDDLQTALAGEELPLAEPSAGPADASMVEETAEFLAANDPVEPETGTRDTSTTGLAADPIPETYAAQEPKPQNLDDDLGAAFANEFEQLQSEAPDSHDPQPLEPEPGSAVQEVITPQAAVTADAPASLDELDFGAAFAEELGVDSVTEAQGWGADETAAAHADFSDAVQTDGPHETRPFPEEDPGHVGVIQDAGDKTADQSSDQNEQGGSRKFAMVALVVALLVGSAVTVYGFLGGESLTGNVSIPKLITADVEPFKVAPDDPGGRVAPNEDKASYERVAGEDTDKVEQASLISTTEEPAELNNEPLAILEDPDTNLTEKTDERLAVSSDNSQPQTNASSTVTPRVVQTVTVKADGTIVRGTQQPAEPNVVSQTGQAASNALQVASNAVSQNAETASSLTEGVVAIPKPVETVTIKKPETTAEPSEPAGIEGALSTGAVAIPQASPLPKPAPKPAVDPQPVEVASNTQTETPAQPVAKSEYVVQVSSQRSPEAAQASFQNLRNRFSALQGRAMSIQKANVNGATFYRVRVQTASRQDANSLCASLQSAGGSCFVTR